MKKSDMAISLGIIAFLLSRFGTGGGGGGGGGGETGLAGGTTALWPDRVWTPSDLRAYIATKGASGDWPIYLVAHAWTESRLHEAALNRKDAPAARRGYERNRSWLDACDVDPERYKIGSIGLWQLLPASGMAGYRGTPWECMDPVMALAPAWGGLYAAVEYARRVRGWKAWAEGPQTWAAQRAAFAAPSKARNPPAAVVGRFVEALRATMGPHFDAEGFAERKADPIPDIAPPWEAEG